MGRFEVQEWIGGGASGQVWKAVDVHTRQPVALKLLDGRHSHLRELRRAAELYHPTLVGVLDQGWHEERPWIAFEYVDGRSVATALAAGDIDDWNTAEAILDRLLTALAHAHARGVAHLDVKPQNLLLGQGGPTDVRLTDFGVAVAWDRDEGEQVFGTPPYMAPEQFTGVAAALGPWTDLYAVGCLAFALCTGAPPVVGTPQACADAHLAGHYRAFLPRFDVPRELTDWLSTLLTPASNRERSAARALSDLHALGQAAWTPSTTTLSPAAGEATLTLPITSSSSIDTLLPPSSSPPAVPPRPALALPPAWPQPQRPPRRTVDDALGVSLVPMRGLPLVGRERSQDELWSALLRLQDGQGGVAWVHGPRGVGRSGLIEHFTQAAFEFAACRSFTLDLQPEDPLQQAVQSLLRLEDLQHLEVRAAAMGLGPGWIEATRRLLGEGGLEAWLRLTLAEGPWIVVTSDGPALAALMQLPTPTLWVVRSTRPGPEHTLDVPVAPLDPLRTSMLLSHLILLEPVTEARWFESTGGRSGVLVKALHQALASGQGQPTSRGLVLQPPEVLKAEPVANAAPLAAFQTAVPEDVASALLGSALQELVTQGVLWQGRGVVCFVETGVATATLDFHGDRIQLHREAAQACQERQVAVRFSGLDRRVLATRQLELAGDHTTAARASAALVQRTPGNRPPREWVVLAHRAQRNEPSPVNEAALALELAALDRIEGRAQAAEAVLEGLTQVPHSLATRCSVERGRVRSLRHDLSGALRAMQEETTPPNPQVAAYAQQMRANALGWLGRIDEAALLMQQAYDANRSLGRSLSAGYCALRLSTWLPERLQWLDRARHCFSEADYPMGEGEAQNQLGHLAEEEGRLDDAHRHYAAYLFACRTETVGDAVFGELNLGLVCLQQGRTREAQRRFERALGEAEVQGLLEARNAARAGILASSVSRASADAFQELLGRVASNLEDAPPDLLRLLEIAARGAAERGWGLIAARIDVMVASR